MSELSKTVAKRKGNSVWDSSSACLHGEEEQGLWLVVRRIDFDLDVVLWLARSVLQSIIQIGYSSNTLAPVLPTSTISGSAAAAAAQVPPRLQDTALLILKHNPPTKQALLQSTRISSLSIVTGLGHGVGAGSGTGTATNPIKLNTLNSLNSAVTDERYHRSILHQYNQQPLYFGNISTTPLENTSISCALPSPSSPPIGGTRFRSARADQPTVVAGKTLSRIFDEKANVNANLNAKFSPTFSQTLKFRSNYLQQQQSSSTKYLSGSRYFDSCEERAQQDFLSLSLSPPLNRRREMPALRGPFVSL